MSSTQILASKKQDILKRWFQITVETYPADTARFLKSQKDPFANPVGQTTRQSLDLLLDSLITGGNRETIIKALDPVMRIRAVQSFSPSKATEFIFSLKQIVNQQLGGHGNDENLSIRKLDHKIDEMAMAAFDVYVACREKIYELKATESRNQFFGSLKRAGLIAEAEADGSGF